MTLVRKSRTQPHPDCPSDQPTLTPAPYNDVTICGVDWRFNLNLCDKSLPNLLVSRIPAGQPQPLKPMVSIRCHPQQVPKDSQGKTLIH